MLIKTHNLYMQLNIHSILYQLKFIKYAPYLQQKNACWALDMVLFYALVLMLLTKFLPIEPLGGDAVPIYFFYFDAKFA